MSRKLSQPRKADVTQQIRPWGLSGFVGKLSVIEVDRTHAPSGPQIMVAAGVVESAHRMQVKGYGPETTVIFRGGGQITFRSDDWVNVFEVDEP
jgi:hypothetical protein